MIAEFDQKLIVHNVIVCCSCKHALNTPLGKFISLAIDSQLQEYQYIIEQVSSCSSDLLIQYLP